MHDVVFIFTEVAHVLKMGFQNTYIGILQTQSLRLALLGSRSYIYQYSYSLAIHTCRFQTSQLNHREHLLHCICLISVYFHAHCN